MGKDFWINRWNTGAIGWHQSQVEPALVKWAKAQPWNVKTPRVLVPLCGKSLDVLWLSQNGFEVVGTELSELACRTFFEENKIPFTVTQQGEYQVFQGGHVTLFQGDMFATTPELLGSFDAVYDRAALIALPPKLRPVYTQKILELVAPTVQKRGLRFLQIVLNRQPEDAEGPPYSVPVDEVAKHYAGKLDFEVKDRYPVEARGPEGSKTEECILWAEIKPKEDGR